MSPVLAYLAAGMVGLWGLAHAPPTARVVHGFSDTSRDNRLVVTQEWIAEAMTMWFMAATVVIATALGGSLHGVVDWLCRASAVMLLAVATLTAVKGARTAVAFKICPLVLSAAPHCSSPPVGPEGAAARSGFGATCLGASTRPQRPARPFSGDVSRSTSGR